MVAVTAPAKILVTGASGFLAVWVVKAHIDKGYHVVGTVRSPKKGEYLKNLFGDKFDYVIVDNQEKPDAYDKAVVGVDAVQHTSSPFHYPEGDPAIVIKPAVDGTLNILESVRKYGSNVKRVVITSSIVAIGDSTRPIRLTEDDWNDEAVNMVKELGANAIPGKKYAASKTLAERAARDYIEKHQMDISWDIVTINPPWIWGPLLHEGTDVNSFNFSTEYFLTGLDPKNPKTGDALTKKDGEYVDVRDVAKAHIEVLEREGASNGRYLIDASSYSWQDIYDALNEEPAAKDVPVGQPGASKPSPFGDSTKLPDLIGITRKEFYLPLAQTAKDTLASARERGWVPPSASA